MKVLSSFFSEQKHVLNLQALPAGIYILKVISGNAVETLKMVKTQ
jgi:hypothetical protein